MFPFALVLFCLPSTFFSSFSNFSRFSRAKRKKEFGRNHSQRKPLTTTTTCIRRKVLHWSLCLLCSMLFIFSERKCISKPWRKLMNNKPENRIPWLLTDFDNIKDFPWLLKKFPDFCLTLKNFLFSLTFPWHILIWDFFSTFCQGIFCYFRQASCDGVRFQASFDHFRRTNWTEDWARLTLWTIELRGLVTMVAKFLDLNNCSWQRRPFAFSNDGRKVWATILIQSAIIHRSHACHFYRFFSSCYICRTTACWDPEILLPWQRDVTASPLSWHVTTTDLGSASGRFK